MENYLISYILHITCQGCRYEVRIIVSPVHRFLTKQNNNWTWHREYQESLDFEADAVTGWQLLGTLFEEGESLFSILNKGKVIFVTNRTYCSILRYCSANILSSLPSPYPVITTSLLSTCISLCFHIQNMFIPSQQPSES